MRVAQFPGLAVMLVAGAMAQQFETPFVVKAGGTAIDVDSGHAAPFVVDFDGDGVRDLLVGQFGDGRCRIYHNYGTNAAPQFGAFTLLEAGGKVAEVEASHYVGFVPHVGDLNGDGHLDVISGKYSPGDISVFFGLGHGKFAAGEFLKDQKGKNANASPPGLTEKEPHNDSLASAPCLVDWDDDGDLDLLVGNVGGQVVLLTNEGDAKTPKFARKGPIDAAGKVLVVETKAGPTTADWDGDGRWDLIVGDSGGAATFFRNEGEKSAPKFAAGVQLVPGGTKDGREAPGRGMLCKPHVCDWNGDGALDLLVGDLTISTFGPPLVLTANQKATKQKLIHEHRRVKEAMDKLLAKCNGDVDELKGPDQREWDAIQAKAVDLVEQLRPLSDQPKFGGFVWVYLRKP